MGYFLQCSLSWCVSPHLSDLSCCHQLLPGHLGTTSALWEASLLIYIIPQQISQHLSPLLLWPALLSDSQHTFFYISMAPFLNALEALLCYFFLLYHLKRNSVRGEVIHLDCSAAMCPLSFLVLCIHCRSFDCDQIGTNRQKRKRGHVFAAHNAIMIRIVQQVDISSLPAV